MDILDRIYGGWRYIMEQKSDPRTRNWFMMNSPLPTIALSATYIITVKIIGPKLMENRKPLENAKKLQFYYNLFHLLINVFLFYEACATGWLTYYSFRCQPVDFSMEGVPYRIAVDCWLYFLSKFTDFFETCIFVMLKRFDMINLYHVAHHSIMPVSVWWGVKFLAGGHSTFFGLINTFVHIVIYTYLLTIQQFPSTKNTIFFWWKPFYPFFQIAQFGLIFLHAFQLIVSNECNYPMSFVYFIGGHAVLFFILVRSKMHSDKLKLLKVEPNTKKHETDENQNVIEKVIESTYETTRQRVLVEPSR
ncbi:unnamed protein product [Chironomus riparius]|uniref:Elongation of very long chain fatty acids protein n=1 Tax=Chironomus riparius TaxID=315576 RepID=A0A9N9RQZ8_9DIPT|nr:unnamed protein product [Chironomus riparius]